MPFKINRRFDREFRPTFLLLDFMIENYVWRDVSIWLKFREIHLRECSLLFKKGGDRNYLHSSFVLVTSKTLQSFSKVLQKVCHKVRKCSSHWVECQLWNLSKKCLYWADVGDNPRFRVQVPSKLVHRGLQGGPLKTYHNFHKIYFFHDFFVLVVAIIMVYPPASKASKGGVVVFILC